MLIFLAEKNCDAKVPHNYSAKIVLFIIQYVCNLNIPFTNNVVCFDGELEDLHTGRISYMVMNHSKIQSKDYANVKRFRPIFLVVVFPFS